MTTRANEARPVIALSACSDWSVFNYRAGLIRALVAAGYRIAVLAPEGPHVDAIRALGADFQPVPISARGTSPVEDLRTLAAYARQLRRAGPIAYLGFTAKPNIYGSLAAHALRIPVINNISGLGAVFGKRNLLSRLVSGLYRLALGSSRLVFFQNPDDRALFEQSRIAPPGRTALLPGSGVDLDHFAPRRGRRKDGTITFMLAARLLWDKGVGEYVAAARRLRPLRPQLRFQILGIVEPPGPTAVSADQLDQWNAEGAVEYLGATIDVRDAFAAVDCMVLPSYYREGVPRVLLEASAMAIPIITTDSPGCREAIDDQVTGLLCVPRSVDSLVAAIEQIADMTPAERKRMGVAARAKMQAEFREELVHRAYLGVLAKLGAPVR